MTVQEWLGKDNKLGIDIWERKYRYENETFDQWLNRVSGDNSKIKHLIAQKKFLYGGRILSNRGLQRLGQKVTYSNCYVLPAPEDSIESIFDCAKMLARTFSYGGGVGIDISKLAPRGAIVNNTARRTTGAISFMDLYSHVTGLIGQNGRRGALMISLDCHHPDLEEFIEIKSDLNKVTKANISIRVTDDFLQAVEKNADFKLSFVREETGEEVTKIVKAADIFHKFCEMNWNYAEPAFLFWDNICNHHLMSNTPEFEYAGTNPCAEEPLPAGGSCLLGSLNLAEFVSNPFAKNAQFDFDAFCEAVAIAVEGLNEVLDEGLELHPLEIQRENVRDWRQIGLGVFGIADMLIKLGMRYGSLESLNLCDQIAYNMSNSAIRASAELAGIYGAFPKCKINDILSTEFLEDNTDSDTKQLVFEYGLRNSQILTIAPTGTLSTMLGVSGGIEPIFANYYTRKTESLHGEDVYYKVYTPIVQAYIDTYNTEDLPSYFVESKDLDYKQRVAMQSVWQSHIDASISSTVNLPEEATIDDIKDLYLYAWRAGLKGITVFRAGCKREAILSTDIPTTSDSLEPTTPMYDYITPTSRKTIGTTSGNTYCKKCACGTLYITINRDEVGNIVESFIHTSKGGICQANIGAINRMISVSLRSGVKVDEIADQLKGVTCPACIKLITKGEPIDGISCPDILGKTLLDFYHQNKIASPQVVSIKESTPNPPQTTKSLCPECKSPIKHEGGCVSCLECGWSKCE